MNGGRIPWNVTAMCENIQDILSDGKTPYENSSDNHLKAQLFR